MALKILFPFQNMKLTQLAGGALVGNHLSMYYCQAQMQSHLELLQQLKETSPCFRSQSYNGRQRIFSGTGGELMSRLQKQKKES